MSEVIGDFPLVHPAMYGKQTRYAYIAVTDTKDPAAQFKVSQWGRGRPHLFTHGIRPLLLEALVFAD